MPVAATLSPFGDFIDLDADLDKGRVMSDCAEDSPSDSKDACKKGPEMSTVEKLHMIDLLRKFVQENDMRKATYTDIAHGVLRQASGATKTQSFES